MQQAAIPVAQSALFLEEEFFMTFQIVLIGSDGLIVGSDRRMQYRSMPEGEIEAGYFQPMVGSKFTKSPDGEVVCAAAGSSVASSIALGIAMKCNPKMSLDDTSWKNAVNLVVKESTEGPSPYTEEVIVIRKDAPNKVLVTTFTTAVHSVFVTDRLCTGFSTPARFLPRHLWRPNTPVRELENLALLAIACAEKENPSGIGDGFEIMTLRAGEKPSFKEYPPDDFRVKELHEGFTNAMNGLFQL